MTGFEVQKTTYALEPRFDSAKSFYGKATVEETAEHINLFSYGTYILRYVKDSEEIEISNYSGFEEYLTQTTMRHVREFLRQLTGIRYSKQEFIKEFVNEQA